MKKVTIVGAGKIGSLIALLLVRTKAYQIQWLDVSFSQEQLQKIYFKFPTILKSEVDVTNPEKLSEALKTFNPDAIISCLPFHLNTIIAKAAIAMQCHYFDLTEDVSVTAEVKALAQDSEYCFVPQCGLAPGMVGVIANHLMQQFSHIETAQLRVGALPQVSNHGLKYALTWSTEGVLNEYDKPCLALRSGKQVTLPALENLESINIEGKRFEAFNTSGGLGNLVSLYKDKAQCLNYKTIRYPGHCEKIKFLMQDLKLREDKPLLKKILEKSIPRTVQDMVILLVKVDGVINKALQSKHYLKTFYPEIIEGIQWGAIQITTASGLCSVLDVILNNENAYKGFVTQEIIPLDQILKTPFGNNF